MTIREQIEKKTERHRRALKITTAMFLLGSVGILFILESEHPLSIDSPKPTWMFIVLGLIAVLYGFGFYGAIVFGLLLRLKAKCPKCKKRFRTLRKDWAFCPFCGSDFNQVIENEH